VEGVAAMSDTPDTVTAGGITWTEADAAMSPIGYDLAVKTAAELALTEKVAS
jgi:hypothetical protein